MRSVHNCEAVGPAFPHDRCKAFRDGAAVDGEQFLRCSACGTCGLRHVIQHRIEAFDNVVTDTVVAMEYIADAEDELFHVPDTPEIKSTVDILACSKGAV